MRAAGRPADGEALPEGSRERILAAAAQLASERGLDGATIAAVTERSGLPASSIYWYFEDKDELFAEVIRASYTQWLASVPQWTVPVETSAEEALRLILAQSTRSLQASPDFARVGMQLVLSKRDEHKRARALFVEIRAQVTGMISAWIQRGLAGRVTQAQADDLASLVVAFSDGILVGWQIYPDFELDRFLDVFLGTFTQAAEWIAAREAGES